MMWSIIPVPSSASRLAVLVLLVLCLIASPITVGAIGAPENTPTENTSTETAPETHTLTIETNGEPLSYVVTASESINPESGDSKQGNTVRGRLGGYSWNRTNDTKDVIKYTGYIREFTSKSDDIRVSLDGRQVPPHVLSANHISISAPNTTAENTTETIHYEIYVNGTSIQGETAEDDDTAAGRTIDGQITGDTDSFYYTGSITKHSSSQPSRVRINGRNANMSQKTDTPTQTPTRTIATETTTSAPTTTTSTPTPSNYSGTPSQSESSNSGYLFGLIGGVVVIGVLVVAGFWYFRPRDRRW